MVITRTMWSSGYWLSHRWEGFIFSMEIRPGNAIMLYLRQGVKAEEEEWRNIRRQRGGKLRREDEMPAWLNSIPMILEATNEQGKQALFFLYMFILLNSR